jgi:hypothetical protein
MYETKDVYNQKGEYFIEYLVFGESINNIIAVKNGIFISEFGTNGIKFFDHQNKNFY